MKNVAVILAGGSGKRYGTDLPKQFEKVSGKLVIEHTVQVFDSHPLIDEIAIVVPQDFVALISMSVINNKFKKVKKILFGGEERYLSTMAALKAYDSEEDFNILLHDAVRPLVAPRIIDNVIKALEHYKAVMVAVNTVDTIVKTSSGDVVAAIPDRKWLRNVQTPQAFKFNTLKKAYQIAGNSQNFYATDDCGVVFNFLPEEKVFIVEGSPDNIKLTHREDLILIKKILASRKE